MIAIIDYGVGNLFSLVSSLKYLGLDCKITSDKQEIINASSIILPGVGAFIDAMGKLNASNLVDTLYKETSKGKPLLGICLGMQLLFDCSFEYGKCNGLGLISGEVSPLSAYLPTDAKVPQMGWNNLQIVKDNPLLKYTQNGDNVYFVHSYFAKKCQGSTIATTDYYIPVTAMVAKDNIYGTQFHPEKSGKVGLNILKAFSEIK